MQSFSQFVKYMFKACDIFLLSLIILWFSWRMIVFVVLLLFGKEGFDGRQNFLVFVTPLGFKMLNYYYNFFACFRDFTHLFLCNFSRLNSCDFFFLSGFLHRHWRFIGQQGKRGDHLLFHSTTSTRSRTLGHLFATLHVR